MWRGGSWSAEKNCICGNELFEGAALFCEILCETREILHGNFWVDYQGLWWGCYETYRVPWVVYPVQKGMTISRRWWAFWRTINVDWWLPTLRKWTISFVQINAWLSEFAEECGISIGSCYETLTEKLRMHWVTTKFVFCLMTADQKQQSNSSLLGTVWSSWRGCNLVQDHNRWWVMGLWIWHWNESAIFTMDGWNILLPQKSTGSLKC